MKMTHVCPIPTNVQRHEGCIAFPVTVVCPANLPKGLPSLAGHEDIWTVYIAAKAWEKLLPTFKAHADDKLILEGVPVSVSGDKRLLVSSVKSLFLEKERQAAQRAAAQEVKA
jgi:hypothetical protein